MTRGGYRMMPKLSVSRRRICPSCRGEKITRRRRGLVRGN